jgi:hypothetical protein
VQNNLIGIFRIGCKTNQYFLIESSIKKKEIQFLSSLCSPKNDIDTDKN